MKHYLLVGLSAVVLNGQVSAAEYPGTSRESVSRSDDAPMAWRIARYPFRVVRTAARTPLILGETLIGRREIVGQHGFFTDKERDKELTMRRVAFSGDRPDND